jgi:hypothetical protein
MVKKPTQHTNLVAHTIDGSWNRLASAMPLEMGGMKSLT